ncbi:MAG: YhgE/Pip family protein [Lawsonella sp.]|uniref:YhgE/Pip family protein n=1 Tax=Lawsonella sp. TaxID=2041415 RepID=UPI002A757AFB|nr:YhgE/Pip family protein [Lawsonella sp.]MDY2978712.1 YhgE/Pip family protein [Lawsonella sp.]
MSDINDSPTTKTRLGKLLNWRPKSILSRILISLLIVLPIAGSAVYMWSMWDPTVYLKHVPIAIVNDDGGVGEDNFGQDVVKGLKEEPYLNISQVDAKEARSGLLEDRYLFTISIPKDFSQKINTVIDPKPQQARINITYNDYNGSAGAFLTGGLVPLVSQSVTASIGQDYAKQVLMGLNGLRDGLIEARNGSQQLDDGAAQLQDGAHQLADGSDQLLAGTNELGAGMKQISGGVDQLVDMLVPLLTQVGQLAPTLNGIGDVLVQSGIPDIVAQGKKVQEIAATLNAKDPNALVNQLKTLKAGAREVSYNLNDPNAPYRSGMLQLNAGAHELANGTNELYAGLAQGVEDAPLIKDLAASSAQMASPYLLAEHNMHPAQKVVGDITEKVIAPGSSLALVVVIGFLLTAVLSMFLPVSMGRHYESRAKDAFLPVLKAAGVNSAVGVLAMGIMAGVSAGIEWDPVHDLAMAGIIIVIGIMAGVAYTFYRMLFGRLVGGIASLVVYMMGLFAFGGIWPLSTTPGLFTVIHPFSPMSYARDAFTLGTDAIFNRTFWAAIIVMILMSIASVVLSGVVRYVRLGELKERELLISKAVGKAKARKAEKAGLGLTPGPMTSD